MKIKLINKPLFFLILLPLLVACGTVKPCTDAGNVKWFNPIKGDKWCKQKTIKDEAGNEKIINHGPYKIKRANGSIALEGEFYYGEKDGLWTEYNEEGMAVRRVFYNRGIENLPSKKMEEKEESKK